VLASSGESSFKCEYLRIGIESRTRTTAYGDLIVTNSITCQGTGTTNQKSKFGDVITKDINAKNIVADEKIEASGEIKCKGFETTFPFKITGTSTDWSTVETSLEVKGSLSVNGVMGFTNRVLLGGNPYCMFHFKPLRFENDVQVSFLTPENTKMSAYGPQVFNGADWFSPLNKGVRIPFNGLYSINVTVFKYNDFFSTEPHLNDDHHVYMNIHTWEYPPSTLTPPFDPMWISDRISLTYAFHPNYRPWDQLKTSEEIFFKAGQYITVQIHHTGTKSILENPNTGAAQYVSAYGTTADSYMSIRYIG